MLGLVWITASVECRVVLVDLTVVAVEVVAVLVEVVLVVDIVVVVVFELPLVVSAFNVEDFVEVLLDTIMEVEENDVMEVLVAVVEDFIAVDVVVGRAGLSIA